MKRYYFGNYEQIQGGEAMIIMDIKADNLYAFKNFHMNMSYPKKIVGSSIPGEYLEDRMNFRYKKVNIIMGTNATGKTTIGRLLMLFTNYFLDGELGRFKKIVCDRTKKASLKIDFVTLLNLLYRFELNILPGEKEDINNLFAETKISYVQINQDDNYESCAKKLDEGKGVEVNYEDVKTNGWSFSYPQDAMETKLYSTIADDEKYLQILETILKTLDPSIEKVVKLQEIENSYAIKLGNQSVIIQDGKISDTSILSSGTKAGVDISYIIASIICDRHDLYYCDEMFSYVNSDIEKACISIIIDKLIGRKQFFFTTHNTDILDMQIPKHSFTFLKKNTFDKEEPIKCISASQYLKRNTDSLRSAVENDLFCTAPELDRLYEIADL